MEMQVIVKCTLLFATIPKLYLNGTQKNQHAVNEIYNTASKPVPIKIAPVLITTACIAFGLMVIYFFLNYKKKSEK